MRPLFYISLIILTSCSEEYDRHFVQFPSDSVMSSISPDGSITAVLYKWNASEEDLLGTYYRWCIGFQRGETRWFVDRELGEGKGTYEGGVFGIIWLNDQHVLIDRRIDDQDADLVFNVATHEFQPVEE